ncbi:unnamed protein product [Fraxinus pennsylvanica]|uniref:Uncharacterized protein n=1 Tax=Fraxinus pennsylvanica TaxID=56036 RepID=A0AAD1ZX26_9LAMI|nr:unnamed protein product [Fraxinus pennsylvanica]
MNFKTNLFFFDEMLKPAGSRNQRSKSLKVKHALQICLLLAICIWLLYQVKQSYKKKSKSVSTQASENEENALQMLKLGRKDIKPQLLEEVDLEDEESKEKETVDGDEDIEDIEKDKNEDDGEPQQLQDLIDEDDKDE